VAKIPYPYTAFPLTANEVYPQGFVAHRPLAIATITASNGESLRWLVLPDTGADACLFPLSLAILLKLDVLKLPKCLTGGVGSQANTTYYDTLTIDLDNGIIFKAYAGFTQGMDSVGMGLLGQDGFFDTYNVEFRHSDKEFVIEHT
jgi:hypothetical protein